MTRFEALGFLQCWKSGNSHCCHFVLFSLRSAWKWHKPAEGGGAEKITACTLQCLAGRSQQCYQSPIFVWMWPHIFKLWWNTCIPRETEGVRGCTEGVRQRGIKWGWDKRVFSQLQGAGKGAQVSHGDAIQKGNTLALWGLVAGRDPVGDGSGIAPGQEGLRG